MAFLLALPIIGIVISLFSPHAKWTGRLNILLSAVEMVLIVYLAVTIARVGEAFYFGTMVYLDGLNMLHLLIIGTVSFFAMVYSYQYVLGDLEEGKITRFQVRLYYFLFNCFVLSMLLMAVLNNVGLMWIALEATTLSTAFLIGFTRTQASLEAAWKYIIICTLGIGLGLLGIALMLYGIVNEEVALNMHLANWTVLMEHANAINSKLAAVAFAIILIGFGTKAGLAPMHTWLPEAHSESPSPICAMMSGILCCLAFYGILRFYRIAAETVDPHLLKTLLLAFGAVSLVVAGASILRQRYYKRILAFSTVENIGIIALGIGFGGIGVYFALFHTIVQALSKALLFFVAGNILHGYQTKEIAKVQGMVRTMPVNAILLLIGVLANTGMPPFPNFISEFGVIQAGIQAGQWGIVALLVTVLLIIFAGFIIHFTRMIFYPAEAAGAVGEMAGGHVVNSCLSAVSATGENPGCCGSNHAGTLTTNEEPGNGVVPARESAYYQLIGDSAHKEVAATGLRKLARQNLLAPAALAALIICLSVYMPDFLLKIIEQAAAIIG